MKYAACMAAVLVVSHIGGGRSFAEVYELNPVIVTATRTEKALLDVPANAQVITGEELKNSGYSSVFEAVKVMTNADVHTYTEDGLPYGGMDSRIRVRGVDNGTLVMINGMPANFKNASTVNNVPMDQVERIEVVKGANSVLYGPQALGGVVNIITKNSAGDGFHGSVFGSYGNRYRDGGLRVNTEKLQLGYKAYSRGDVNDVEKPGSTGLGPAISLLDGEGSQFYGTLRLTDDLTASFGHTNGQMTYESSTFIGGKWDADNIKRSRTDMTWTNWDILYDSKDNGWRFGAGYHTMDLNSVADRTAPKANKDSFYHGYNATLDGQKRLRFNGGKDTLVLGVNYNKETLDYGAQTNSLESYAFYQSWDHAFTDRFNMIFGVREYFMNKSQYLDSANEILPQVQGLYKLNESSSLYFNVGRAFEMPSVSQFFSYGEKNVINPALKPQSSWSYEVGYKHETEAYSFAADVFYMDVTDKFYFDTIKEDGIDKNIMRNRDKWENRGLELNYTRRLNEHHDLSFGLTWQDPKAQSGKMWVQDAAKLILNAGTSYHKGKFTADARIFSYMNRESAYYNRERTKTNKFDHDLKNTLDLTVSLSYSPTEWDTFRLVGRNLLDREDAYNKYEYVATPVNYVLTYERRF